MVTSAEHQIAYKKYYLIFGTHNSNEKRYLYFILIENCNPQTKNQIFILSPKRPTTNFSQQPATKYPIRD